MSYDVDENRYYCDECGEAFGEPPAAPPVGYERPAYCEGCKAARPRTPFGAERAQQIWDLRGPACSLVMSEGEVNYVKDLAEREDCARFIDAFLLILNGNTQT